jgi:hypothetical protein
MDGRTFMNDTINKGTASTAFEAYQTSGAYWRRIKTEFDERKIVDPVYDVM